MNQKDIDRLASARKHVEKCKLALQQREKRFREAMRSSVRRGGYSLNVLSERTGIKGNRIHNYLSNGQSLTMCEIQMIYREFKFPLTQAEKATMTRKPRWKKKLP